MPPISLTIESSVRHSARTKPISKAVDQSGEDALELPLSKGREKRMRVPSMKQQALSKFWFSFIPQSIITDSLTRQ